MLLMRRKAARQKNCSFVITISLFVYLSMIGSCIYPSLAEEASQGERAARSGHKFEDRILHLFRAFDVQIIKHKVWRSLNDRDRPAGPVLTEDAPYSSTIFGAKGVSAFVFFWAARHLSVRIEAKFQKRRGSVERHLVYSLSQRP